MNKIILILFFSFSFTACVPLIPVLAGGGIITTANIENDRRSAGVILDDKNLASSADWALQYDKKLKKSHINVNVFKGIVLLTGEVSDKSLLSFVEKLLKEKFLNIIGIHNELVVAKKASLFDIAKDTAITSAVLLKFQNQEVFNPTHIKVITERTVVYLMGSVTKREGKLAGKLASQSSGVTKVVKLFEYLAKKPKRELDAIANKKKQQVLEREIAKKEAELLKQKAEIQRQLDSLNNVNEDSTSF
ncbi:21 kDa hemolysin precursor [hydrothermal vent metagenome]|uniref:21 kDa hemolysin n=1 Tax=hydrothermal vent metagenome TaxID=652676 RepID=A0A1W1CUS6_9ZZZZ